jgi:hypothetical protein
VLWVSMSSCGTSHRGDAAVMTFLTLARPKRQVRTLGADRFVDARERAGADVKTSLSDLEAATRSCGAPHDSESFFLGG